MGILNFGRGKGNNQGNPYGQGDPYGGLGSNPYDQGNPYGGQGGSNPYNQGNPYGGYGGDPYGQGKYNGQITPYNQNMPDNYHDQRNSYGQDDPYGNYQNNNRSRPGGGLSNLLGRLENADFGGMLFILAAVVAVGLLLYGGVKYGPGIIQSIADGLHKIIAYFKEIAVISLIIWFALLVFLGRRRLPGRSPFTSLAAIFILVMLCQFFPDLGSAFLTIIIMIVGLYLIIRAVL